MDFLKEMPAVFISAVSAGILTLCVSIIFLVSYNEKKHARQYWNKISGFMELAEPNVSYPLKCDEILIGRHASADIRLPDLSVSRYHAILTVSEGVWTITDIGSKSGVFVNGNLVHPFPGVAVNLFIYSRSCSILVAVCFSIVIRSSFAAFIFLLFHTIT